MGSEIAWDHETMKEISGERNNSQGIDTNSYRVLEMGSKQQKKRLTNKMKGDKVVVEG